MGNDYQLKKVYEQMVEGNKKESSIPQKPRTLNEAYKHILTERTAFYAKNIGTEEEIPSFAGLEKIGAVEDSEKIKHTIASQSVLPAVEHAMSAEVSGWGSIKGVDLDRVAKDFIVSGVSGADLEQITAHKKELTAFAEAVTKPEVFNLATTIIADVKEKAKVDASSESLELIFKRIFEEEGTIAGTAVGKGELAISLFTNCAKGKTGDLLLPSGKTIEIKGKGGRLGPAEYSQANTAKDLAQFIETKSQEKSVNINRELVVLKSQIRKYPIQLETDNNQLYNKIFTDKFKTAFNFVADNLDKPEILDIIDKTGFKQTYSKGEAATEAVWKAFSNLGYIKERNAEIPVAPMEKDYVKDIQNKVRTFLLSSNKGLLQKGRLERITGKSAGLEAIRGQSFTIAVQNFFLNDLGLTSEEAAQAFLLTKSYDKNVDSYLPEITKFFQEHYKHMIEGELVYLKAAVFAFQLALYAQAGEEGKHFDYFMIMNNNSTNALSLDVARENLFTYLTTVYIQNTDKIDLSIRADGRQGASAITLK